MIYCTETYIRVRKIKFSNIKQYWNGNLLLLNHLPCYTLILE